MFVCRANAAAAAAARHARVHRSIISLWHASLSLSLCALHSALGTVLQRRLAHAPGEALALALLWLSFALLVCRSLSLEATLPRCLCLCFSLCCSLCLLPLPLPGCQTVTTIIDRSVCDYVVYLWALTCVQICLPILSYVCMYVSRCLCLSLSLSVCVCERLLISKFA